MEKGSAWWGIVLHPLHPWHLLVCLKSRQFWHPRHLLFPLVRKYSLSLANKETPWALCPLYLLCPLTRCLFAKEEGAHLVFDGQRETRRDKERQEGGHGHFLLWCFRIYSDNERVSWCHGGNPPWHFSLLFIDRQERGGGEGHRRRHIRHLIIHLARRWRFPAKHYCGNVVVSVPSIFLLDGQWGQPWSKRDLERPKSDAWYGWEKEMRWFFGNLTGGQTQQKCFRRLEHVGTKRERKCNF